MPTTAQIQQYETAIKTAATGGTPTNPRGLPANLASLLVAQAKHETGNFSSPGFTTGNNAFGYSYVSGGKWQLPAPGRISDNNQPLAQYASIGDSTREIVDWIYRRIKEGKFPANLSDINTPDEYGGYLKSAGYYTDTLTNYVEGLKRWVSANKGAAGGMLLLAVLGIGAFVVASRRKNKRKKIRGFSK